MSFVPAHRVLEGEGARKTAFVLHGILGAGQNFTSFIQKLSRRCPEYRFVLVDLRNHGASSGAPPPHTVAACADDLLALAAVAGSPSLLIGHSFGGKVALEYARRAPPELEAVWVLDSNPGPQGPDEHGEIDTVLRAIRAVPMPASTRADVVSALEERGGLSRPTAEWLATSVKRTPSGYVWLYDLDAIEALLADYYALDLWPYLGELRSTPAIHLVIAERSDRFTPALRERALSLPASSGVRCHLLPDSGHWVHVDNPGGLLELMAPHVC